MCSVVGGVEAGVLVRSGFCEWGAPRVRGRSGVRARDPRTRRGYSQRVPLRMSDEMLSSHVKQTLAFSQIPVTVKTGIRTFPRANAHSQQKRKCARRPSWSLFSRFSSGLEG
jgi:hypothetical protein